MIFFIPLSLCFLLWGTDLRWWGLLTGLALLSMRPRREHWEWLALLGAGVSAALSGYRIEFVTNFDGGFFYLGLGASLLVTLGWIFLVTQGVVALGRFDHSGRLTAKALLLTGGALLFIAIWQGQLFGGMILGLALSAVCWLQTKKISVEHWGRALGYTVALAAIAGLLKTVATLGIVAPLMALGLPFSGQLAVAYSARQKYWSPAALLALYALTVSLGVLIFLAPRISIESWFVLVLLTTVSLLFLFWLSRDERFQNDLQKIRLLGTRIDRLSMREAVARLQELVALQSGGWVCTPDTTAVLRAQNDQHLKEIYEEADLVTPDGTGIVWASQVLGSALPERVSGIDLLERFFATPRRTPLRVFLLGAAPGVAAEAGLRLQQRFSLEIVGVHHGYFDTIESERILEQIRAARPDLLLVGMGMPRQEFWMKTHRERLAGMVLMGVGGCFDVWSRRLHRAPQRWRRLGLEWAYRVLQEPKRLARVSAIPLFVFEVWALRLLRLWE